MSQMQPLVHPHLCPQIRGERNWIVVNMLKLSELRGRIHSPRTLWSVAALALLISVASLALSLLTSYGRVAAGTGQVPSADFGKQVEAYLMANPKVIMAAVNQLEAKLKEEDAKQKSNALASRRGEIFDNAADPVGGNPQGDAAVVEFFDYNCPYCRKAMPVMKELEKTDTNLRIVYKEFPILGPGSEFAAKAALAAVKQGKYSVFHDAMMSHTGKIDERAVLAIAEAQGLDITRLKLDMASAEVETSISRNMELAQALGITGTPGFVIGDEIIGGLVPLRVMQDAIARARQPKSKETSQ